MRANASPILGLNRLLNGHEMKNLLVALLIACTAPLAAADYPDQPIRIIVPFAAGGGTDVMGRMLAQKLSEAWKVPVTVDNRAGAGGTIGSTMVARAAADGYTILLGSISTHAISPGLYTKLAYDPVKDLAAVARAGITPFVMTVHPGVPANTDGELIAMARAEEQGVDLTRTQSPKEFGGYVQTELVKWRKIIRDAGAKLDRRPAASQFTGSGRAQPICDAPAGQSPTPAISGRPCHWRAIPGRRRRCDSRHPDRGSTACLP